METRGQPERPGHASLGWDQIGNNFRNADPGDGDLSPSGTAPLNEACETTLRGGQRRPRWQRHRCTVVTKKRHVGGIHDARVGRNESYRSATSSEELLHAMDL